MKYCAKCGSELKDEAFFCPNCGCLVTPAPQKTKPEETDLRQIETQSETDNSAMSVAALVLGIIAFVTGVLSLVFDLRILLNSFSLGFSGILAVIFAAPNLKYKKASSIIGFVFGILGLAFLLISSIIWAVTYYNILF